MIGTEIDAERHRIRTVIDRHEQRFKYSCPSSLAEMMLKLVAAVGTDYYDEQNRDQNNTTVGVKLIKDKTIAGRTFRKLQDVVDRRAFAERIDELLDQRCPVGIFLQNPDGYHGWIICPKENGSYLLLAKASEEGNAEGKRTVEHSMTERQLEQTCADKKRDCIYIEPITA